MISSVESFWLKWHAAHDAPPAARRARIVLLAEIGVPPLSIAKRLKTPPGTVTRALGEFQKKRLNAFSWPILSVPELLKAVKADLGHARYVSAASVQLFHIMELPYRLPAHLLPTLETAARVHNVGMTIDQPNHHLAGRDILQHVQLRGFSKTQQRVIACLVRFHRKRVRPEEEPLFSALPPAWRRRTLQLAAILRVADGLDYSQTQSTRVVNSVSSPEAIQLQLTGPESSSDGERAKRKSDLWESVFHIPFEPTEIVPPPDLSRLQDISLSMDSPLSRVIQRMMAKQMLRWQIHEDALLAGDPAGIKAVRSAVRRIGKTLEIASRYSRKKTSKKMIRSVRKFEELLCIVRDLDVLLLDARNYLAGKKMPPSTSPETEFPVVSIWEQELRKAQTDLVQWLDGKTARALHSDLLSFLTDPPLRQDPPLSAAAPGFIADALGEIKKRQGNLAKDELKTYHRMRLALRQFRYTLELCGEAPGPAGEKLLADIAKVQKRLGLVSDAWLIQQKTIQLLDMWAERQAERNAPQLFGANPILEYAQDRRSQLPKIMRGISKDWKPVRYAELYRRMKFLLEAPSLKKPDTRRPSR